MTAGLIAFSQAGYALGLRLAAFFTWQGHCAEVTRCPPGGLRAWTQAHFQDDALVFIGSCGIAVRAVAPFLRGKTQDPAVVVMDEGAAHAVSLLSGHLGGANALTVALARFAGARPVVTTATDVRGLFAVDAWAARQGLAIANPQGVKPLSARILAGKPVSLSSDFPIRGPLPQGVTLQGEPGDIAVTCRAGTAGTALTLIPPVAVLGLGCKKGVPLAAIEAAAAEALRQGGCHPLALARVCSVDLKAGEPGILAFCQGRGLPFQTFSPQALMALPGSFAGSSFVRQVTGADNICERAAVLGAGEGGRLLAGRRVCGGVTAALALAAYSLCFDEV
jgi:cobalt-precorrin 5A hydrolase